MHRFLQETTEQLEKIKIILQKFTIKMYEEVDSHPDEVTESTCYLAKRTMELSTLYDNYLEMINKEKEKERALYIQKVLEAKSKNK